MRHTHTHISSFEAIFILSLDRWHDRPPRAQEARSGIAIASQPPNAVAYQKETRPYTINSIKCKEKKNTERINNNRRKKHKEKDFCLSSFFFS
jgi:hypothetical protein